MSVIPVLCRELLKSVFRYAIVVVVGRPGSLDGQSKEYPTKENETSGGYSARCFFMQFELGQTS